MKSREDTGGVVLTGDVGETNSNGDGRMILQVECGLNKAVLHLDKLCQGSKGACVLFDDAWMTPNEFQAASGRELAKDWKRSIKHHDKSLKLLIGKGFLFIDPAVCRCEHCVSSLSSTSTESPPITTSPSETKIAKDTKKRPAKTELGKRAKKQKVNNVRTAKSTSVGTTKLVRTNKSASVNLKTSVNVGTNKSAKPNNSVNADTEKSNNIDTDKSADIGTVKLANVVTNKSANVVTSKSANVGTIKWAKTSMTTKRGKQQKSSVRQRQPGTVRKGKRVTSPRNAKKTTSKTKPKRASRSRGSERTKKEVNGTTAIAPEGVNGEQREHVADDTELSEDNSEHNATLAYTNSSPKQNDTVEENGEETDSDSIKSTRSDGELTREKTVPSVGSDSDTHDAEHESNMQTVKTIGTGPRELDDTEEGNDSSSGSERSCTPLSNYIANKSGKGCKITIKKTTNGFLSGDDRGVISPQQRKSGDCSAKAKSRKSVVMKSAAKTVIGSGVVVDYKTDDSMVDHDVVSHTKSDTDTDVVSDSEVGGPSEYTLSDAVTVCKTDKTVVDVASCCKTDSSTEINDIASHCKTDNDTDVHDAASRFETDAPTVTDHAMSDCETGGSGELIVAEPENNEESANLAAVSTGEASSNVPEPIFSSHSKHTDSGSLPAKENDQSFTKPERENQDIDTADKSHYELLGPSDDDTEVSNNNLTSPAAHGEPISPKREARLLNIIQELKTYKKQLSAKIDETKRHVDFNVSPLHDILQNDKTLEHVQQGCAEPESRSSPGVRDNNSEPPSSNGEISTFVRQLPATSFARDLMNAAPRRTKTRRKESAIIRQLTGPTVGQARTQAWVNENGATIYYTAQSNGGGSLATIPFSTYGDDSSATVAKQIVNSDSIRSSRYNDMASDTFANSDKCLLKVPNRYRYSDNVSFPLRNGCDVHSAQSAGVRKRKSAMPRTPSVSKKQRCSWPLNKTDAASCLLDLTKCIASNGAAKTNINTSYDRAPSQTIEHLTDKSIRDIQVAAMTRPVQRSHISSWTADDVYSFILSSPHAAIYAKDFLELRITGRVLQNLTAIQMMRILRIGEHAARAVRTAVEKVLLTSSAARNQSIRR